MVLTEGFLRPESAAVPGAHRLEPMRGRHASRTMAALPRPVGGWD